MNRRHFGLAHLGVAVAVLATLLLALPAPAAQAHGDSGPVYSGQAGPYRVYAFDGSPAGTPGTIRYELVLWRSSGGQPVDGATVTVAARLTGPSDGASRQVGPVRARGVANVYQFTLPDPGAGHWRTRVTVDGATGIATTAAFELHGLEEPVVVGQPSPSTAGPSGPSPETIGLIMLGVAAATLVVTLVIYRRGVTRSRSASVRGPAR